MREIEEDVGPRSFGKVALSSLRRLTVVGEWVRGEKNCKWDDGSAIRMVKA